MKRPARPPLWLDGAGCRCWRGLCGGHQAALERSGGYYAGKPAHPRWRLWIRTQHRVGRRTRENMVWPQVSLAQMAALLHPTYKVKVIDANAERMGWPEFAEAAG
jgi:hypothetical protein